MPVSAVMMMLHRPWPKSQRFAKRDGAQDTQSTHAHVLGLLCLHAQTCGRTAWSPLDTERDEAAMARTQAPNLPPCWPLERQGAIGANGYSEGRRQCHTAKHEPQYLMRCGCLQNVKKRNSLFNFNVICSDPPIKVKRLTGKRETFKKYFDGSTAKIVDEDFRLLPTRSSMDAKDWTGKTTFYFNPTRIKNPRRFKEKEPLQFSKDEIA